MESFTEVWNLVCDYCKSKITDIAYSTWIKRIEPVNLDFAQGVAVIKVPNELHRQTIKHYYMDMLDEAFTQIFGQKIQIRVCTPDETGNEKQNDETPAINDDYEFTFDTYIVGSSNKFAHAASMSELDSGRQDYLLNHLNSCQVFITCCEPGAVKQLREGALFEMDGGTLIKK